jgi:hypothetical protein
MRRLGEVAAIVLLAACAGTGVSTPSTSPPASGTRPSGSSPAPAPEETLDLDVGAADLPIEDLLPEGAELAGSWIAAGGAKEAVLVAWSRPSSDPFAVARGYAAFRREAELGQWWVVYRREIARRAGVLGVTAITADVTGDGAEDALVLEETGGTGACGTYRVIDLQAGEAIFERSVCDTRIDPSSRPRGLSIRTAVYGPDDPHCCPSAFRTTVLVYEDGSWSRGSVSTEPA